MSLARVLTTTYKIPAPKEDSFVPIPKCIQELIFRVIPSNRQDFRIEDIIQTLLHFNKLHTSQIVRLKRYINRDCDRKTAILSAYIFAEEQIREDNSNLDVICLSTALGKNCIVNKIRLMILEIDNYCYKYIIDLPLPVIKLIVANHLENTADQQQIEQLWSCIPKTFKYWRRGEYKTIIKYNEFSELCSKLNEIVLFDNISSENDILWMKEIMREVNRQSRQIHSTIKRFAV